MCVCHVIELKVEFIFIIKCCIAKLYIILQNYIRLLQFSVIKEIYILFILQGKAWTWHADDFSEGELRHEKLSIKFKNFEVADNFKKAFDQVVLDTKSRLTGGKSDTNAPSINKGISMAVSF